MTALLQSIGYSQWILTVLLAYCIWILLDGIHDRAATTARVALPVFLVFEILFYGFLAILSERTNEMFPFWAVIAANTLAAICMGAYLWRRHPALRDSIHDTPLGAAPLD